MKKLLYVWAVVGLLFGTSQAMAQNTSLMPKSEPSAIEQLKMAAFAGENTEYIPYASDLYTNPIRKTTFKQRMEAKNPVAKLQPISTHPVLKSMVRQKAKAGQFGENSTADLEIDTVLKAAYWGIVGDVETGKNLLFTVEYENSTVRDGLDYYLKGARYTFYNDKFKKEAAFYIQTSDTTQRIEIMSQYSSSYFNGDNKREFIIQSHGFAAPLGVGPSSCRDTLFIVNENGQVLKKIGKASWISLHFIPEGWEKRAVFMPAYYEADTVRSDSGEPVLSNGEVVMDDTIRMSVFKAMDLVKNPETAELPAPLHTFKLKEGLAAASEGPLGDLYAIEGQYYYITAMYDKSFFVDMDNMTVEKNNKYNVVIYKAKTFEVEKTIALPLIDLDLNDLSFSTLRYFGKYMISRKLFNNDDKFEILYAMSRYEISCDCEKLQFYLMDEEGKVIEKLVDGVSGVLPLQAIPGEKDEYALLMGSGSAVEAIKMFELPSMKENFTFPAVHENEVLSTNIERVPAAVGGYEYVIGLGRGEETDNTVYGGIAHYNRSGKMVKRVRIDLGEDIQLFSPIIQSTTLNPYMILPDNQREYLFFFKKSTSTNKIQNGFGIANEEKVLYAWADNETDGTFQGAGVKANDDETEISNLYISFEKNDDVNHTFYSLPLQPVKLEGKGTAAEPYIITTPAELNEIRRYPKARFVLGNDIDMIAYTGVSQKGFAPIAEFTGVLDGQNHIIKNLLLAGEGMFTLLNNATVCNLILKNVMFAKDDLWTAGCLTSKTIKAKVLNCHVETDITTSSAETMLGGLVGLATNDTKISRCSFKGHISAPNMEKVGGMVGRITGKSMVSNSYTQGKIEAFKTAGGVAGENIQGGGVANCYSEADIYTKYASGGVVGGNSGGWVEKTYSTGNITVGAAAADEKWDKGVAGGVVGETNLNGGMIKYSYGLNDTIIAPERYTRVAWTEFFESADDEYESESGSTTAAKIYAMDSNYALASMLLGVDKASLSTLSGDSCKINRLHGEGGSYETFNQAFYEQKTKWAFGTDSLHPWVMSGKRPHLWIEFLAHGIKLSLSEKTLKKDSAFTLQAFVMPENAANKNVRWTSSNEAVATVSTTGEVKGLAVGETVITATTEDGGYTATCRVKVVIPVEKVMFGQREMTIGKERQVVVNVKVLPEDATNKHVMLYSLNTAILMASGNLIYGLQEGTALLMAVAEDGGAADTCTVRVGVVVEEIYLDKNAIELYLSGVNQIQLKAEIYPKNAINGTLVWSVEDSTVCSVSDGLVTGLKKGQTKVWVMTEDSTAKNSCKVTVNEGLSNEDLRSGAEVSAYINNGYLTISSSVELQAAWLYDLNGQCVWSKTGIGAAQTEASVADLPSGLYLVKIRLTSGQETVVKVRR